MSDGGFHLAQLNIGRMRAPLGDPVMAGFEARLEEINALADRSPGFVWRLQSEEGDATSIRAFDDDRFLVNMSVWTSLEALRAFVYQTSHSELLRGRREWFEPPGAAYLVLWWVPAGELPTLDEAVARLEKLRAEGPGPAAFDFRHPFPPPAEQAAVG